MSTGKFLYLNEQTILNENTMKKSFIKVGFVLGLALVTSVSLTSCSSEADAEGEATEQTDAEGDQDADKDAEKCEEGKDGEHKCEEGKCEEGKCEAGEEKEGKSVTKGGGDMKVNTTVPEEKPVKKSTRGGEDPKMTTGGN
ncbi:MAG: hypothetical protein DCO96_02040 [Fluviicola sp. XM-24bin1]|nr:MAG: hypothetical protein DCO96_02040 [Fluviicola sp. XM-24bin1]